MDLAPETPASRRGVQFSSILASLIDGNGYRGNRSELLAGVGITTSALSQYLTGRSRPSFATLVALAQFFDVSLDYLVFGQASGLPTAADLGPLARYVDASLRRLDDRSQQHTAVIARVGSALSEKINQVAGELVGSAEFTAPSFLSEDDAMFVESHSLDTRLILLDLSNDILEVHDSDGSGDAMGHFLPTVSQNLVQGRPYRFLVPGRMGADWRSLASRLRGLLRTQCSADSVNRFCEVRVTDCPLFCGLAIYRLDVAAMKYARPAFYEIVGPYLNDHGWVANVVPPYGQPYAAAMLDELHLRNAIREFEYLWARATRV